MSLNHDIPLSGHMGIAKTSARVKQSFMWYKMRKDVELFVKSCFPLPHQSAKEVARCVVDGFISRFGCPLEIHTDQGKIFDDNLFASVCELLHIVKKRTTLYRPCSNGQVERYNRTLLQLIRCFLQGDDQTWDDHLPQLAGAIRSIVNRNTGFTPNLMMLGREVILPVNIMIGITGEGKNKTPAEYVLKLRTILNKVHTLAREILVSTQMRQKKDYDLRLKENTYEVGDLVYLLDSARKIGQSSKLQQIWKGPTLVTKVLTSILFEVTGRKKPVIIHHDSLFIWGFTSLSTLYRSYHDG